MVVGNSVESLDTQAVDLLIQRMLSTEIMSRAQEAALWEAAREERLAAIGRMLTTGETYGVASGATAFLNQPEDKFRVSLRAIDNDLHQHVKIVDDAFTVYLKTAEPPAPYYAMRIAIILRKAKMKPLEKQFLKAWCRHFAHMERRAGVTYDELLKRAVKMGVEINA